MGLLAATLWLAHPYLSPRLIGAGDAMWYHHLLADTVTQFRAGVFPVYVGQSDFQFNGAVYPIRVAPYHQYFAGLLDLLSGRSLGFFALQHLTIILSFIGGAFAAYFTLTCLAPDRRWEAALLALLYVFCPGVAGLAYAQDLFMSVMTLPWVPLALGGAWLMFRENSRRAHVMLVTGLGALWWAHSPIALWVNLLIMAQQVVRLVTINDRRAALVRGVPSALVLALLITYPVVSAFLLRAPGENLVPYTMDRSLLLQEVRAVFPACMLPLSSSAARLSQLQLGYALWAVFAAVFVSAAWRRKTEVILLALLGVLLACLLLPIPGVNRSLWLALPEPLVGLTLYWPMQRLYIVLAAITVIGAQAAFAVTSDRTRRMLLGVLGVGVAWSMFEARSFHQRVALQTTTTTESAQWARTENIAIQRHSYHLFSRQPDTMSHGVMDPWFESRLLDPSTGQVLSAVQTAPAGWQTFTGTLDANPGILNLAPALTLEPGRRYLLSFDFAPRDYTGVLQMRGPGFYREYLLPASGNTLAFGSAPAAGHQLTLWTSGHEPLSVELRFIPTGPGLRAADFSPFARYQFRVIDPAASPVVLESLIPFRATVRAPRPAWLVTPRMFVPGYAAEVNGAPAEVQRTSDDRVAVPVPTGESLVVLRFAGPLLLRLAFWLSFGSWLIALPVLILVPARRRVD